MTALRPLVDVLEDEWDRDLFRGPKALATMLGWTSYHTLRSKGSKAGYPDRTLVRERIIFAELKREKAIPSSDQIAWLDKLAAAGVETYLWRPSDLDEVARILSGRWQYTGPFAGEDQHSLVQQGVWWRPASLWIPGRGRNDQTEQQSLLTTEGGTP